MDTKKLNDRLLLVMDYLLQKDPKAFKTRTAVSKYIDYPQSNLSSALNGNERYLTDGLITKFIDAFPELSYDWLRSGKGEMLNSKYKSNDNFLSHIKEPEPKINPTKEDALNKLHDITSKGNGKHKNANEGKIVNSDTIIKIKTYVIPMKGFAGLKNAIYDDQYITDNFEQTTTDVPSHLYAPISYRIQSSGKSMPISIPHNAWVTGVPVPEMMWMSYKFNEDKIYILFHPYRGILFKRVENVGNNEIKLCSENPDKIEYPDEVFKITEFRKILLAIKVETFL